MRTVSLPTLARGPAISVFPSHSEYPKARCWPSISSRKCSTSSRREKQAVHRQTSRPDGTVDLILIVDAYHEFSYPYEMGAAMARALQPGGLLVLIEYRAEDPSVPIKRLHKMTEAQAKREMAAVGLEWVRTEDFLPQQHFLVFRRP